MGCWLERRHPNTKAPHPQNRRPASPTKGTPCATIPSDAQSCARGPRICATRDLLSGSSRHRDRLSRPERRRFAVAWPFCSTRGQIARARALNPLEAAVNGVERDFADALAEAGLEAFGQLQDSCRWPYPPLPPRRRQARQKKRLVCTPRRRCALRLWRRLEKRSPPRLDRARGERQARRARRLRRRPGSAMPTNNRRHGHALKGAPRTYGHVCPPLAPIIPIWRKSRWRPAPAG